MQVEENANNVEVSRLVGRWSQNFRSREWRKLTHLGIVARKEPVQIQEKGDVNMLTQAEHTE